jgi:hypothetical protein
MNKELIKDKYHDAGFRPRSTDKRKRKASLSSEAAFEKIHHKLGWPKLVTKLEHEKNKWKDIAERSIGYVYDNDWDPEACDIIKDYEKLAGGSHPIHSK